LQRGLGRDCYSESEYPLAVIGDSRDHLRSLDLELVVSEEESVGLVRLGGEPVGDNGIEVDETIEENVSPQGLWEQRFAEGDREESKGFFNVKKRSASPPHATDVGSNLARLEGDSSLSGPSRVRLSPGPPCAPPPSPLGIPPPGAGVSPPTGPGFGTARCCSA